MTPQIPEQLHLKDDGTFPNSSLPVLIYRSAVPAEASHIESLLASHHWTNSWRNGVYDFPHYHSTSHEVLAVYGGEAQLLLGGPQNGQILKVSAGDVLVLPAGTAHQNFGSSPDFAVVGAYPNGRGWDLLRGDPGDRPRADANILRVPLPEMDPIYGAIGPLLQIWSEAA